MATTSVANAASREPEQIVYVVVKEIRPQNPSKCSPVVSGVYASIKDANNKVIESFNPKALKKHDEAHHGVKNDGTFWWSIKKDVYGDFFQVFVEKHAVIKTTNHEAKAWGKDAPGLLGFDGYAPAAPWLN